MSGPDANTPAPVPVRDLPARRTAPPRRPFLSAPGAVWREVRELLELAAFALECNHEEARRRRAARRAGYDADEIGPNGGA